MYTTYNQTSTSQANTLLDCPRNFNGEYGFENIERFINYVEAFKKTKRISDGQALFELEHLLVDHAFAWWLARKSNIKTWTEALQQLRTHFSHIRPAHAVYADLFEKSQNKTETLDSFLNAKLELIAQLPKERRPTEITQLDMLYALLPPTARDKLQRHEFSTIAELKKKIQLLPRITNGKKEQSNEVHEKVKDITPAKLITKRDYDLVENTQYTEGNICGLLEERELIIKVRRTQDLMPTIKVENDESKRNEIPETDSDEFIADETPLQQTAHENNRDTNVPKNTNTDADFQIDNDLMCQINNIIENCDADADATEVVNSIDSQNIKHSEVNAQQQQHLHKPMQHVNQNFFSYANRRTMPINENALPFTIIGSRRSRRTRRCMFCLNVGHRAKYCMKRQQKEKEFCNEFEEGITSKNNETEHIDTMSAANISTSTNTGNTSTIPTTTTTATTSTAISTTTATEMHTTMTTKLIPPAVVPSPTKALAFKAKPTDNSPAPKCHQCGTVGYYRSICPNCSPIYYYKPGATSNR